MGFLWLFILDEGEDLLTVDVVTALVDDGITDLSDKYHKSGGGVIVGWVSPDEKDHVHGGHEQLWDLSEVLASVSQRVEQLCESLQVLAVLISFLSGSLDLLLKFREGASVGGLVLFQELKNFLDSVTWKLLADGVQVVRLVLPELDLSEWVWVLVSLQSRLRVLL